MDPLKWLPWAKLTAPMVPMIGIYIYLGQWLSSIYSVNLTNKLYEHFPTSNSLLTFAIIGVAEITIYAILSLIHFFRHLDDIK